MLSKSSRASQTFLGRVQHFNKGIFNMLKYFLEKNIDRNLYIHSFIKPKFVSELDYVPLLYLYVLKDGHL